MNAMTMREAMSEAKTVEVRSTEIVKGRVRMVRLTNGIVGFGKTNEEAEHEAYHRCAIQIMRCVNTGRISMLTEEQIRKLSSVK